ncbi:MAG TPA: phosphate acyltransferase PlsX [Phycisphaeraceae bacterium]|nr:phosphate acyltransferase PlsX [Phycisphaeraceae bacterium]
MRIAVDVMGGDHAPDAILDGALASLDNLNEQDELILFGRNDLITDVLTSRGIDDPRVIVEHAPEVIGMDESPVDAVRSKPNSSVVRMMQLAGRQGTENRADIVISAGNTGACVSAATMYMKRLPGVHRPGVAVIIPTYHGPIVVCDVGANPEPRPSHLVQYGLMAEVYARKFLGMDNPRVAQINIGSEEAKGTMMIKEVRKILRNNPAAADINYIGYVEGRDLVEGVADVFICDGFVGNVVLKLAEGLAKSVFRAIEREIRRSDPELGPRFASVVRSIYANHDYHEFGGAPLLGVNGCCIIAHGSSEARTITNAILKSRDFISSGVNEAIVERLAAMKRSGVTADQPQ